MLPSARTIDNDSAQKQLSAVLTHVSEGRLKEAAEICTAVIAELPRDGTAQELLVKAYERLIYVRESQTLEGRAFRLFRQYLRDCAPACDPAYDDEYTEGLRATRSSMVPLRRRERFYCLVRLLSEISHLDGLVAECGCFRGLSSYVLCRSIKRADSGFDGWGYRIFDSFAGLSVPGPEDAYDPSAPGAARHELMMQPGAFAAALEVVKEALAAFPRIEYFPGWMPEAFPDEPDARYRFVHLDVDLYQPTRDSLDYFYPRLVPGGRIVCDDYNWPGGRMAVEEFCGQVKVGYTITQHKQALIER